MQSGLRLVIAAVVYAVVGVAGAVLIGDVGGPLWFAGIYGLPVALLLVWFIDRWLSRRPYFQQRPALLTGVATTLGAVLYQPTIVLVIFVAGSLEMIGGHFEGGSAARQEPPRSGPPQLWSDHRELSVSVSECADRAVQALNDLGYAAVKRSGNYAYGNLKGNRAAVKCVERAAGSFVYFAVAGAEARVVEELRNDIARRW